MNILHNQLRANFLCKIPEFPRDMNLNWEFTWNRFSIENLTWNRLEISIHIPISPPHLSWILSASDKSQIPESYPQWSKFKWKNEINVKLSLKSQWFDFNGCFADFMRIFWVNKSSWETGALLQNNPNYFWHDWNNIILSLRWESDFFWSSLQIEANPMIVLWRGNGVHVLRADIGPINLIYWAFNGIPSPYTKSYILQWCNMRQMISKPSHMFITSPLLH